MTEIYLIRHGEAEGNLNRRMHGQYNSSLTSLGVKQAEALGKRFRDIHLDAVYSSDLLRAEQTAAPICLSHKLPLHTDSRLREISIGPWEDVPFGEAWASDPEEMNVFRTNPALWKAPGCDTCEDLAIRGCAALRDIAENNPGKTIAVTAHSYMITAIIAKLFYGGVENWNSVTHSDNTAVTLLQSDGTDFHMVYGQDASHLDAAGLRRTRWLPEDGFADLHFVPLTDVNTYIRYRGDAWQLIYGDTKDFVGAGFWLDAQQTVGSDPNAMVEAYLRNEPVGMLQLSPERESWKGAGYIPFIYLRPQFRQKGLGIQLIGHAVSFYRNLGRKSLQLSVAPTNEHAIAFYEKFDFKAVGKTKGRYGKLILMEKGIRLPELPRGLKIIPEH